MKQAYINTGSAVNYSTRQRGASLLEGIAYLGIAALVILGAVSLLTGAFSSAQSNRGAEEIVSIRSAVKKLYMGQANSYGTGDITAALNTAKVFPATLSPSGSPVTAMVNTWGGNVNVVGVNNTFTITYTGVPQDACISMISGANGWQSISQGGTSISTFPLSPANAAAICSINGANSIVLTSL